MQRQSQYKKGSLQPKIKLVVTHLGNIPVSQLRKSKLEDFQATLLDDKPKRSPSYTDQTIGVLRTAINKAVDDDLLLPNCIKPFRKLKKALKRKRDNARERVLSSDEYDRLVANIPVHLMPVIVMSYWTGMRIGEILGLTWDKVFLNERKIKLKSEDTKEEKPKTIPIFDPVYDVLESIPHELRAGHVILFRGKPIKTSQNIIDSVRKTCKKANIPYGRNVENGFTIHDLRHTFVTNARRAGISQSVIMGITGHSTAEMFARYNLVDENDIEVAADLFSQYMIPSKKKSE